jgi:hypothetical protein
MNLETVRWQAIFRLGAGEVIMEVVVICYNKAHFVVVVTVMVVTFMVVIRAMVVVMVVIGIGFDSKGGVVGVNRDGDWKRQEVAYPVSPPSPPHTTPHTHTQPHLLRQLHPGHFRHPHPCLERHLPAIGEVM